MSFLSSYFGKRSRPAVAVFDRTQDPWFWSHYDDAASIVLSMVPGESWASGRSVVDFGCGDGITALGIACRVNAAVMGIDLYRTYARLPEFASRNLGASALPTNLDFRQNELGKPFPLDDCSADLAYSWSVFEHVADVPGALSELHRILKPGGTLFIQIDPLFYSPFGSHLQRLVDRPWAHLLLSECDYLQLASDASDQVAKDEQDTLYRTNAFEDVKRYLIGEYKSLNRITADELAGLVKMTGFEIVLQRLFKVEALVPPPALAARYPLDHLTTNQIVLMARRT